MSLPGWLAGGPAAFRLGPRARVRLTGPDARRYLEGQLSNSLRHLRPRTAIPALLLTAKGKLCAPVWVWEEDEGFLLDAEAGLASALEERVARYIVADDVCLEPAHVEDAGWHVVCAGEPPAGSRACRRLGVPGWDSSEEPSGVPILSAEELDILRIALGVPAWGRELDADTLPHEAGLEREAVDFHKGCYVGQETVSRLESVGRPTRRLRGLRGDFPAQSGIELLEGPTRVGKITSAVRPFELPETWAMGYVSTRCSAPTLTVLDTAGEPAGTAFVHEFPLA